MIRYDSTTQAWEDINVELDEPAFIVGKNVTDSQGNAWMFRWTNPDLFENRLDCLRPDGSWMNVPPPPFGNNVQGIRAKSPTLVFAIDGAGGGWRFDGTTWTSLGNWNDSIRVDDIDADAAEMFGCAEKVEPRNEMYSQASGNDIESPIPVSMIFFNEDLTVDSSGQRLCNSQRITRRWWYGGIRW